MLALEEVEHATSVGRWTLHHLVADGRLKGFEVGPQYSAPVSKPEQPTVIKGRGTGEQPR